MSFQDYAQPVLDFVRTHHIWAAPIAFVLAFAESLAFISLLVPAWGILVAMGALISATGIPFWQVVAGGALGAACGYWLSYWFGQTFGDRIAQIWPLSNHPTLLPRGQAFMRRWGVPGIFIGRFFGPLRAAVPLVAGIVEMPYWTFQVANFTSAFCWAFVLLKFGDIGVGIFKAFE